MALTEDARQSLRQIQAEISQLQQRAASEPNPQMAAQYLEQAEYAKQKGQQIYSAGRNLTGTEIARAAAQGATLGFGDEIEAGLRTGFGMAGDYDATRDDIRAQNEATRQQFPQDAMGLELLGTAPLAAFAPGAAWLSKAPSTLSMLGRTAALGGAEGGLYGWGGSEGTPVEQLIDSGIGAIQGVGVAGGLASLPLVKGGARRIRDFFTQDAVGKADDLIMDLARRTGLTPEKIQQKMSELGPDATMADLNTEFQKLLLATRQKSPTAGTIIDDTIGARQGNAQARLMDDVREVSGVDENVRAEILNLKNARRMFDTPTYTSARKDVAVLDDEMLTILQNPAVRSDANKILRYHNINVDDLVAGQGLPIAVIDDIKKTIDRTISTSLVDNTGKVVTEGMVPGTQYLRRGQKRLVAAADDQSPMYNRARAQHAYFSEKLEPIDAGRKYAAATDPQVRYEVMEQYASMTPEQQRRFRQGVVASIESKVADSGGTLGTGFAGSKLGTPGTRGDRFTGAAGGSSTGAQRLEDAFQREGTFYDTYRLTDPNVGSKTSAAESASATADEAAGILSTVAGAADSPVTTVLEKVRSVRGLTKPQADEIAKRLTSGMVTPEFLRRLADDTSVPLDVLDILKGQINTITRGTPAGAVAVQSWFEE